MNGFDGKLMSSLNAMDGLLPPPLRHRHRKQPAAPDSCSRSTLSETYSRLSLSSPPPRRTHSVAASACLSARRLSLSERFSSLPLASCLPQFIGGQFLIHPSIHLRSYPVVWVGWLLSQCSGFLFLEYVFTFLHCRRRKGGRSIDELEVI